MRLAEAAPDRAVAPAAEIARTSRKNGDFAAASTAERALGIAALHLQDTVAAARHLRRASALAHRASAPDLAVEADLRLAAVLNVRGQPVAALRAIDSALSSATGASRARAWAQRGAILLQLDRLNAAHRSLELAVPGLRSAGDQMWLKRALANRGLVHARRNRFAAAQADLREALQLNRDLGLGLSVAFVEQNLGWVATLRGDVPGALEHLDRAERTLRDMGAQTGFLLQDRAVLLLSVGLVTEARAVAGQALRALERERQRIAVPDAYLLLARSALLDGDPSAALIAARRAARGLAGQGRPEGLAQARLLVAVCRASGVERSRIALRPLQRLATALDAASVPAAAVEARLLAAELAYERGDATFAHAQLLTAANGRQRGPASTRALAWQAESELRIRDGRPVAALRALTSGVRVLDEYRAGLGSSELRAHAVQQRVTLAARGLAVAIDSGRLDRILTWAEHGRASLLLLPPLLPSDDEALGAALADLRSAEAAVAETRSAGGNVAAALRRQISAERRVRDRSRRLRGSTGPAMTRPVTLPALIDRVGEQVVVEYVEHAGWLYALVVARSGATWSRLAETATVKELTARLPFALARLAGRRGDTGRLRALVRDAASRLDGLLLAPLTAIGDGPLVVVPTGCLQALPWALLPSCVGRAVTVAPSATSWISAAWSGPRPRAVAIAGPGLPGAVEEAAAVAALYGITPIAGPGATVRVASAALAGAEVAHLATHGRVHPEHPLLSALTLADGPLTAYDLERLDPVPRLVVLAGCDTGRPTVRAGDELLGLSASLIARGTVQVIASVVPVPDALTAPLMTALHRGLLAGHPAAQALANAQARLDEAEPHDAVAAGFVSIGGTFRIDA